MEMVSMYQGKEITEEEINKIRIMPLTPLGCTNFIRFNEIDTSYNFEPVWEPIYQSQKRLKCAYCDCINNKDFGICDYCGAPLKE